MAEIIKYNLASVDEDGTVVRGPECSMPYNEKNLALAEAEAFGAVTVEDDGLPEPLTPVSNEERITAIETKFAAMEAAYAEGVREA